MAKPSLADLKARIKEKENKKNNNSSKGGLFADYYPFFRMTEGQEAVIRLLPDQNEENPELFHIEKYEHTVHVNGNKKSFPCLRMYGEECPACERSRKYYGIARDNGEETKGAAAGPNAKKGKYYYAMKTNLSRALIIKDPLPIDPELGSHQGKTRTLSLGKQIMDRIYADIANFDENDALPWDLDNGYDFIIRSGKNGANASYTGSGFARKPSPVAEELRDSIKLIDLSTLLPKNPTLERVYAILEAHDNGSDIDESDDSAPATKPATATKTVQQTASKSVQQVAKQVQEVVEVADESDEDDLDSDDSIPFDPDTTTIISPAQPVEEKVAAPVAAATDDDDDDILARIKNRNKKV